LPSRTSLRLSCGVECTFCSSYSDSLIDDSPCSPTRSVVTLICKRACSVYLIPTKAPAGKYLHARNTRRRRFFRMSQFEPDPTRALSRRFHPTRLRIPRFRRRSEVLDSRCPFMVIRRPRRNPVYHQCVYENLNGVSEPITYFKPNEYVSSRQSRSSQGRPSRVDDRASTSI